MGRKRSRTWKYIYFLFTGLISLFLTGCVISENIKKIQEDKEAYGHLLRAKDLLAHGDYEGSLKENRKVLSLADNKPPADEALFNIGLIYSHYGYQKKDYKESLNFYRRLVRDFPGSPLVVQAKIWIGVLEVIEKTKQVDIEIEEKKKELSR